MKYMKMKTIYNLAFTAVVFLLASCDDEFLNPSSASNTQVLTDVNGLITVANGLQYQYSVGQASPEYAVISASGLLTRELLVLNVGNQNEQLLYNGGNAVQGSNGIVNNVWSQSNLIKSNANLILANLSIVTDQGTKGALQAHASIYKALALGNLAMFWQSAPIVVQKNAPFVPRLAVLQEAITTLQAAQVELAKAPISTVFTSKIVPGIDYANTINALIARFSLMAGDYATALTAASAVSLAASAKSTMNHDDASPNAMFFSSFGARNNTEPADIQFSLPAALLPITGDGRIAFFFNQTVGKNLANASFFINNSTAVPIYRPGEMALIKAECHVRKAAPDLPSAVTELNSILQKTAASDYLGIGANLPAYGGAVTAPAILDEIYKQRCIELYLSGMRLEDNRRFGRPVSERGRDFLPYPFTERDNNTQTPADPAF